MTDKNYKETLPYSSILRSQFEFHKNRDNITYTQTEILNNIMKLCVERENENKYIDNFVTKEQYFAVMYDVINHVLFSNK